MPKDLRHFLAELEAQIPEEYARVKREVDPRFDGYDTFTVRPRTFGAQVSWSFK